MKPENKTKKNDGVLKSLLIALIATPIVIGIAVLIFIALGFELQKQALNNCDRQNTPHSKCQW